MTGSLAPRLQIRRKVVGASVDEDENERQLDTTRLEPELRALKDFPIQLQDWRHLEPSDIAYLWKNGAPAGNADLRLLSIALFTGTAQACMYGQYWAPNASCPDATKVDCRHVTRPTSRLHTPERPPTLGARSTSGNGQVRITCAPNCHPLDLAARMMSRTGSRVAVVRYTSMRDSRNEPPTTALGTQPRCARYSHCREDQVFFRTSYWQAFERMKCDINAGVGESLDLGGLIYTPGVGIMRGPIEEGALWYQEPPRVDIVWVAVPPRPQLGEQNSYAQERDRNAMARVIDHIFLQASAAGVDVLVMPPLGIGSHGCQHPSLDVADLIYKAAQRYASHIPQVCIGADVPVAADNGESGGSNKWWEVFSDAVQNGRPPISKGPVTVSIRATGKLREAGILYGAKDFDAMLEKHRRLNQPKARTPRRMTFL